MSFEVLRKSLISEIDIGIDLLEKLSDETYSHKRGDEGSIGAHFRHNLEFIEHFLDGLENGRIDYCQRERDTRVETERSFALKRFRECIERLAKLETIDLSMSVSVNSEIDPEIWLESSLGRETEFVQSHTVHHYALVAAKLRALGESVPQEFGVAPSTLRYWASLKTSTKGAN